MIRRTFPLVMILLVLTSLVAVPAMAQTIAPDAILLDQDVEEVGSVTVDGDTYYVYQIDNRLPYASGVEVYVNDEQVTSESEAVRAIRALTQQQAIETLDEDDLEHLEAIASNMSDITDLTEPMAAVVEETMTHLEAIEAESSDGDDAAWAAINESAGYEAFNESQAELLTNLDNWVVSAEHVEENTTVLVELLDQHLVDESVEFDVLYDHYVTTIHALEEFDQHTGDLSASLALVSSNSAEMAVASYGVTGYETDLTLQFAKTGKQAQLTGETLAERTAPIQTDAAALDDLQRMAERSERSLTSDWDGRIGAASSVYQTIIAVSVALVAGAGAALWKLR